VPISAAFNLAVVVGAVLAGESQLHSNCSYPLYPSGIPTELDQSPTRVGSRWARQETTDPAQQSLPQPVDLIKNLSHFDSLLS